MSTAISYKHASLMRRLFAALFDGVLIGLFGSVLMSGGVAFCAAFSPTQPELLIEGVLILIGYSFPALLITEIFGFPAGLTLAILSWRAFSLYW